MTTTEPVSPRAGAGDTELRAMLREFYGRVLASSADLEEGTCCTVDTNARYGSILELVPAEVRSRAYGCGCPIPEDDLAGLTVLDLGSGAGLDAFVVSYLVGPDGFVHGVDMTPEQLDCARRNAPEVARRFGYAAPNTAFHEGFIETADAIEDDSVDLVISDCVINLSPAKDEVFATFWRVLKPGGELYFSDVYADRRVPRELRDDPRLFAECVGGADYEHDGLDRLRDAGFLDPRIVTRTPMRSEVLGQPITFSSLTLRAQKFVEPLDRRCEDYGQLATYDGGIKGSPARYVYDDHHVFEAGRPTPVCRNTARMLAETRLGRYFEVTAPVRHFGLFDCGPSSMPSSAGEPGGACCA